MLDKFHVQVDCVIAKQAAEHFISEVELRHVDLEPGILNQMMTFCAEVILISEHRSGDFTMTNTQAVWIYTWYNKSGNN